MSSKHHREFKKKFNTQIQVNGENLKINHFVQETVANMFLGFLKTLKEIDGSENIVKITIKKLVKTSIVDAHTYP